MGDHAESRARATAAERRVAHHHPLAERFHGADRQPDLGPNREAFWQDESFDHRVQGAEQTSRIVRYIEWNPVSAGFVEKATDWPWSSAGWQAKAPAPLPTQM